MKEKGLKGGLLLLAFALILSKHLNDSKVYYIHANGEVGRLVQSTRMDTKKDLTFHEYNLIVSSLSGKWLILVLNNTKIAYKVFDVNRVAFWENLLLLTALVLIIFNLKIKPGVTLLLIITGSVFFAIQSGFKNDSDSDNPAYSYIRTHVEGINRNLNNRLDQISGRVDDYEGRLADMEYTLDGVVGWD